MTLHEQAKILLGKAREDITVLRELLSNTRVSDDIWGFHAQQAVEKLLKAQLAIREIVFPFTHRLHELADLLEDNHLALGVEFESLLELTGYAVELRYARLDSGMTSPLDRVAILQLVGKLEDLTSSRIRF